MQKAKSKLNIWEQQKERKKSFDISNKKQKSEK